MKNNLPRPRALRATLGVAFLALLTNLPNAQLPHRFEAGTPARASEVNENLEALETSIAAVETQATASAEEASAARAAQEQRIAELEATVASQASEIATLSSDVAALTGSVTELVEQLGALTSASPEDLASLSEVMPHLRMVDLDIGGGETQPAVRFEGVNLQVVNGSGATNGDPSDPLPSILSDGIVDGLGNLIIGYNEGATSDSSSRNGSHNLVVGIRHSYASYSGVVFGRQNQVTAPAATVTGGFVNKATGFHASISGGELNEASNQSTSVSGGQNNKALGYASSAMGGQGNHAENFGSTTTGGFGNTANGVNSVVSGGKQRTVEGTSDWAAGGLFEEE